MNHTLLLLNLVLLTLTIAFLKPSSYYKIRSKRIHYYSVLILQGFLAGWVVTVFKADIVKDFAYLVLLTFMPVVCFLASMSLLFFHPTVVGLCRNAWFVKITQMDPEIQEHLEELSNGEMGRYAFRAPDYGTMYHTLIAMSGDDYWLIFFDGRHLPPKEFITVDDSTVKPIAGKYIPAISLWPYF